MKSWPLLMHDFGYIHIYTLDQGSSLKPEVSKVKLKLAQLIGIITLQTHSHHHWQAIYRPKPSESMSEAA